MADLITLKNKLKKANYLVTCNYNTKNDEYVLTTPQNIEYDRIQTVYKIVQSGIYIKMIVNDNIIDDTFKVPAYAISTIIMSDIIFKCNNLNYNLALIHFCKDEEEVTEIDFFNSMKIKYRKGDEDKSILLRNLITSILLKNIDIEKANILAKTYNITTGYNLALKIIGIQNDGRTNNESV